MDEEVGATLVWVPSSVQSGEKLVQMKRRRPERRRCGVEILVPAMPGYREEGGLEGVLVVLRLVFDYLVFWRSAARKPPFPFGDKKVAAPRSAMTGAWSEAVIPSFFFR